MKPLPKPAALNTVPAPRAPARTSARTTQRSDGTVRHRSGPTPDERAAAARAAQLKETRAKDAVVDAVRETHPEAAPTAAHADVAGRAAANGLYETSEATAQPAATGSKAKRPIPLETQAKLVMRQVRRLVANDPKCPANIGQLLFHGLGLAVGLMEAGLIPTPTGRIATALQMKKKLSTLGVSSDQVLGFARSAGELALSALAHHQKPKDERTAEAKAELDRQAKRLFCEAEGIATAVVSGAAVPK